ncbi:hypothetical protein [Myxosarcina sp. GI1]|uniref:hypothetical protein n=1 Tax=Myxosarcina sp. GI1 TaxID=1541065 RepID=UPI0005696282|nr:hypothetical protein [Myxosarcina sp. GI1]
MNPLTIANSSSISSPTRKVFEYSFSVINRDGDVQNLTAAFTSVPSASDWSDWLSGWFSIGYSLLDQPILIQVISAEKKQQDFAIQSAEAKHQKAKKTQDSIATLEAGISLIRCLKAKYQ